MFKTKSDFINKIFLYLSFNKVPFGDLRSYLFHQFSFPCRNILHIFQRGFIFQIVESEMGNSGSETGSGSGSGVGLP